jgi:hypothetical protein
MPPKKTKKKGKMKPLLVSSKVSSSQPSPLPSLPPLSSKEPILVDTDTLLQNPTTVATDQHRLVKKPKLLQSHNSIKKAPSLPTSTEQTVENVAVDGTVTDAMVSSVVCTRNNRHDQRRKMAPTYLQRPFCYYHLLNHLFRHLLTLQKLPKNQELMHKQ